MREAEYRALFEAAGVGNAEIELPAGQFTRVNHTFCELVGYSSDELIGGMTLRDLTHPADWADQGQAITPASEEPTGRFEMEKRYLRKDGGVVWVRVTGTLLRDADGRATRLLESALDVTSGKAAEEQLRRNRDAFAHLIESNPFGIYVVDADFRLAQVSRGAQKVFAGVRPLIDRDFAEIIRILWPEPFATEVIGRFRHTLATGEAYQSATTVERRADIPETEAYDWRIERIAVPDGRSGVVCYFYDLSERQRLEAELRRSESFHRQTLESIPGMVFTNTPDGACDYVSEQWVAFTGVPAADQLGDGWVQVLHPEDRASAFAAWHAAVEGRGEYDLEYRVRRADGDYEWFKVRGRAIRDGDGAIARWFGAAVNVDDLKRAEAALRDRTRELQTLADNTPDIMTRFDRDLRHVFVNTAVEKATGLPRAAFLGKTNRELGMSADLCELWEAALRSVLDERQPRSLEFTFPGPSGERHYAARLVPEPGPDGAVEFVLGVTHDVTDRKRFEQTLADQDKRKDEFLATLAHELRNPLTPIRTGLSVLRMSGEVAADGPQTKILDRMDRQLEHLVNLVDDLLDVSRISQGKFTLKRERVSLCDAVAAAAEACRPTVDAKGHTMSVDLLDRPLTVDADRTRLVQVVSNLITNAAKYTEPGGRIRVAARAEGGEAVVVVTDTGVGIAPELLPTLWDMFTQVRETLDKAQGGLGIGLSLVKKLVHMHGGTVAGESAGLGRGSTFTVRLPLAASASTAASPPQRSESAPAAARRRGRRVLVVDDNLDGAESLAELLHMSGHETVTAQSGPAALALVRTFAPEVVFLDIGLPGGMDGYEVARRLRVDPLAPRTVLVALTGWGSENDKRMSIDAGFDLHLTKPVASRAVQDVFGRFFPSDAGGDLGLGDDRADEPA